MLSPNTRFNLKVNTLTHSLFSIAYNLTKNIEDAQDLIQETIYKGMVNREKFMKGSNLKGWLYTIMKNIFINNYRRELLRQVITGETQNQVLLSPQSGISRNYGETAMALREIDAVMTGIDAAIRVPFIMHYQGFKYEEIAKHLSIPLGTVKSRIFFAKKEMKRHLKRY